jgi:hypothetical protein
MKKTVYMAVAALFILVWSSFSAEANIISSTFDTGSDGWQIVSFENMSVYDYSIMYDNKAKYDKTNGYIWTKDPDDGDFTYKAPDKFLGNQLSQYGSTLSYDIIDYGSGNYYQTSDVMLVGGGERLLWQSNVGIKPTQDDWTHVDLTLSNSKEWLVYDLSGAHEAVKQDFMTVLGNLSGLYIRGEYIYGLSETSKLDNVQLGSDKPVSVPEPSTVLLFCTGLVGAGLLRRRLQR